MSSGSNSVVHRTEDVTVPDLPSGSVEVNSDETLILATELLETVKSNVKTQDLEDAIRLLQDLLKNEDNTLQTVKMALCCHSLAMSTRFSLHGWIDDFDEYCGFLANDSSGVSAYVPLTPPTGDGSVHWISDLERAFKLIHQCRNSIDIQTLDTVICMIEISLADHPEQEGDPNTLRLLGNALVLRYLNQGEINFLDQALQRFRVAASLCHIYGTPALRMISYLSLAHVEFLRFEGSGNAADLLQVRSWFEKVTLEDTQGLEALQLGEEMAKGDEMQLQNAIMLLSTSLGHRVSPHPRRPYSLTALGNAMLNRYHQRGNVQDLEASIRLHKESLELRPIPHPLRAESLNYLAHSLSARFEHAGDPQDLDEAVVLCRESVVYFSVLYSDRSALLGDLAGQLSLRFHYKGDMQDLEESILLHRESLGSMPLHHPNRALLLSNLAFILWERCERKGESQDLEESILIYRKSLELQPDPSISSNIMHNLACALSTRFLQNSDTQDLEECIALHRKSLSMLTEHHPNQSRSLNNLAVALSYRYLRKGDFQDLDESILLQRRSLALMPLFTPSRHALINTLADTLLELYRHRGDLQDLEEGIRLLQELLSMGTGSYSDRSPTLTGLGNALLLRYRHQGGLHDLTEGIRLHRESLILRPASHPDRPACLVNLANALEARFEQNKDPQDLEECINLFGESLRLCLEPRTAVRYNSLNGLAASLKVRFELYNRFNDLDECILIYQELTSDLGDVSPPSHPTTLINLAGALNIRYQAKPNHNQGDAEDALRHLETAAKFEKGFLLGRLRACRKWARNASAIRNSLGLEAYNYTMNFLPLFASLDLKLEQRQTVLRYCTELTGGAVRCAIEGNHIQAAIEWISAFRLIFWSQASQLRTPMDRLAAVDPSLAGELRQISAQLERASYGSSERISSFVDLSKARRIEPETSPYHLAIQRERILDRIRQMEGFRDFLLPPSFSSLTAAADHGPIIILNSSERGCDTLIMRARGANGNAVLHIPLPHISLIQLKAITDMIKLLAQGDLVDATAILGLRGVFSRDMSQLVEPASTIDSNEEAFRTVLEILWKAVVEPVIRALELEKTPSSPPRIWWCPIGPFAFIPIHAAGIYSDDHTVSGDCLFDYAVSSYCSSPQDLIAPRPKIPAHFKVTAVIEPEVPGAIALPATREELVKLRARIPQADPGHLITHVGSVASPTRIQDVFDDIRQSSIVHFGCHAVQRPDNALESSFLLSGGKLTMSQIIRECQTSQASLAYLSACETAKGDDYQPDQSLNLVSTMMFAGFRGVVGTMWSIFDEDGPIVADVFYGHLFRHGTAIPPSVEDAAYGLHLATSELRNRGRPLRSWVPFVYYGI